MTPQEKFRIKKLAKKYTTLFWASVILFTIFFICIIIWRLNSNAVVSTGQTVILAIMIFSPLIVSIVFVHYSYFYQYKLVDYKNTIKKYRRNKYFLKALECIEAGDIDNALYYYNHYIPENSDLRIYLIGIITFQMAYNSTDPEYNKLGLARIKKVKELYNTDNINFK